jgi:hypothetical protein
MSPATDKRARLQGEFLNLLRQHLPHDGYCPSAAYKPPRA